MIKACTDGKECHNKELIDVLVDALRSQNEWWNSLPGGIDILAEPGNDSPDDMLAHIGGLAVQEIIAVLEASNA